MGHRRRAHRRLRRDEVRPPRRCSRRRVAVREPSTPRRTPARGPGRQRAVRHRRQPAAAAGDRASCLARSRAGRGPARGRASARGSPSRAQSRRSTRSGTSPRPSTVRGGSRAARTRAGAACRRCERSPRRRRRRAYPPPLRGVPRPSGRRRDSRSSARWHRAGERVRRAPRRLAPRRAGAGDPFATAGHPPSPSRGPGTRRCTVRRRGAGCRVGRGGRARAG